MKRLMFAVLILLCTKNLNAQHFAKVDAWLANHVKDMGGRVFLLIYKDGRIVYSHSENELNPNQKMLNKIIAKRQGKSADLSDYTADTRQQIASCSKWLSAALVMTFVDEGKLKLTDTVGKYLPILSQYGKGKITISQCLSHLTAIRPPSLQENLNEMRGFNNMDDAMASIAILPMEGIPGKVFHYSNTGLQIAGAVIEKIGNKSFESLFQERIAKPLAMKNTDFGNGKVALPAGGASSTPNDYINFLTMVLNKGTFNGKRILSEKSIAEMQVNRITEDVTIAYTPTEAGHFGYGFGEWVMDKTPGAAQSKSVSSPGLFGSFPWVNNEQKYSAFLMAFYLKSDGRGEKYAELKKLIDDELK